MVIKPYHFEIDMADKNHLNLIITGHIDNGKSTTMGHFLMDLGVVDERTIAQHAEESEKTGKGDTFKYAWVMDNIKDERASTNAPTRGASRSPRSRSSTWTFRR